MICNINNIKQVVFLLKINKIYFINRFLVLFAFLSKFKVFDSSLPVFILNSFKTNKGKSFKFIVTV